MKRDTPTAGARRPAPAARTEPSLGDLIRQLRADRRLSVRTLATRAAFSPSFISQVELNQASPSIASLERLAGALGVALGDFFRGASGPAEVVTRSGKRRPLMSWWSRARIEALSAMGPRRPFEAVMITLAAGGSSGSRPHSHPAHQFALVFEGEVRLTLGEQAQTLARGDAVTLDADIPHRWENPGPRPARLVIVSSRIGH